MAPTGKLDSESKKTKDWTSKIKCQCIHTKKGFKQNFELLMLSDFGRHIKKQLAILIETGIVPGQTIGAAAAPLRGADSLPLHYAHVCG